MKMWHHVALSAVVCASLLSSHPALAQFSQQGQKLVGTGAVFHALLGTSVSLSTDGNTAIVGGSLDNNGAGAAWVWTRSGGVWTQQGTPLRGSGAVGGARQGQSVSLSGDGNTAIVGGSFDNGGAGAAWVWTRNGGVWTQLGPKLVGSDALGNANQGISVSLSGDGNTAIVGGNGDDLGPDGAAWVWTRSGGVWTQLGTKLVGSGAVGNARQGNSVCLSADGKTAIVGGYADNSNFGAAWVFADAGAGQVVRRRAVAPPGPLVTYLGQAYLVLTIPLDPEERQFFVLNPGALADSDATLTDTGLLFSAKSAVGYRVTFAGREAMVMLDGTFRLKLSQPLPGAVGEIASVDGRIRQSFASDALVLEGMQPPPINIDLVLSSGDDAMNASESGMASVLGASAIAKAAPSTLAVTCVPSGACQNTVSGCGTCCLDYNGFCADAPLQRHADLGPGQTCFLRLVQFIHSTCYWWVKNGCCINEGAILSIVNQVTPLGLTGPSCYVNHTGRICQSIDYTTLGLQLTAGAIVASKPPPLDHDLLDSESAEMVVTSAINVPCGATQQLQLFNNTCYNSTTVSLNPAGGACTADGTLSQSGTILHYSQTDANTFVHNSQTSVTYTAPSAIGGQCANKGTDTVVAEAAGLQRVVVISVDCNARILSPDRLGFSAAEGGFNPSSQTVTIKNIGPVGSVLNYRLASDASWLSIDGPLRPLASGDSQAVTIAVNISGLTANGSSPNTYQGDLTVTDADTPGISQSIPVTLTIEPSTQPAVYRLTVATTGSGAGSIEFSPPGTSCGNNCSTYANNSSVTLTESSASGSTFSGWSGACSGSSIQCLVVMTQDQSVTASFNAAPSPPTVVSFIASPPTISAGQLSVLSWTTTNATSVSIDNGVGPQQPNSSVSASPSVTTTYRLTAMGPGGTATATATVAVNAVQGGLTGTYKGTFTETGVFNGFLCQGVPYTYSGSLTLSLVQAGNNLTGTFTYTPKGPGGTGSTDCQLYDYPQEFTGVGQVSGTMLTFGAPPILTGSVTGDTITMSETDMPPGYSFTFTVTRTSSAP